MTEWQVTNNDNWIRAKKYNNNVLLSNRKKIGLPEFSIQKYIVLFLNKWKIKKKKESYCYNILPVKNISAVEMTCLHYYCW